MGNRVGAILRDRDRRRETIRRLANNGGVDPDGVLVRVVGDLSAVIVTYKPMRLEMPVYKGLIVIACHVMGVFWREC